MKRLREMTLYLLASLWMMTSPLSEEIVKRDPLLEGTIVFDKRGEGAGFSGFKYMAEKLSAMKFDKAFSLHRSARTSLLLAAAGIRERIGFETASLATAKSRR